MKTNESADLVIEPVAEHAGYRACERLQREVWGFADVALVPDHALHTIVEAGGLLIGAYDGVGPGREMVGFVLSLLGRHQEGPLRHCSMMAAVAPGWQNRGLGYRLKLAQREHVLQQGIHVVTWTFDPLESRNAHFNLNKLGAVVTGYLPNYYGEFRDKRNRGLASDRFLCEWHLDSERVRRRLEDDKSALSATELGQMELANRSQRLPSGLRKPAGFQYEVQGEQLLFEIPADLQRLREEDLDLARAWRLETRKSLGTYMEEGYIGVQLLHQADRSFLILRRAQLGEVLAG
ncbi:MAG: GNAT family N-acetyltransferase [Candidatus Bipolaricaulota bacterium]